MADKSEDKVIDFVAKRKDNVEKKRRQFERLLFENFLGSYSVIDDQGSIYPITLVDISDTGCLFEVPWNVNNDKKFDKGMEVNFRMYFTQTSYIPVSANVKYSTEFVDEDSTASSNKLYNFRASPPARLSRAWLFEIVMSFFDKYTSFSKA